MVFLLGSQSSIQKLCISEIVMFALFRSAQSAAWWASVEGTVLSMWSRATIAIARPRRRRPRSFRAARSLGVITVCAAQELGRASCRERVGRDVGIAGVAGQLK